MSECNPSKRARYFPPINPPQTMQLLEPSNNHNNTDAHGSASADVSDVHANAASTPPPLSPRSGRAGGASRGRTPRKSETITPPFDWATDRRATVHSRQHLLQQKIFAITGSVECKRCKNKFEMVLDLENKLAELWRFIQREKATMHDRAPKAWLNPVLPKCDNCGENSVHPFLAGTKKKDINWLFLLLAQMLGCCTLRQLKYFLKHTNVHRTGAKDRVLFSVYMGLCKQLVPEWFDS